jgi:hypothetical protein
LSAALHLQEAQELPMPDGLFQNWNQYSDLHHD